MTIRHMLRAAAALLAFAAAPAMAQNCVGFSDVPAASPFCPSVEWMRNRGITTGCGTGTTYCPNDAVTRLTMSAFMQRMGDKLTPFIIEPVPTADSVTQLDLSPAAGQVVCPSGNFAVTGYPRRAYFHGRVNLYNPSQSGDFVVEMVFTDDAPNSTQWRAVQNSAAFQTLYAGPAFTPGHDVSLVPVGFLNLEVGRTYRFGMRVQRYTGTTANVAAYCVNLVSIYNRTVGASPFDVAYEPPHDAMPPQGRALPRP
jgi:hypothetical protein